MVQVTQDADDLVDLNNFAAKKTVSAGALGLGLLSSNADQVRFDSFSKLQFDFTAKISSPEGGEK